MHILPCIAGLTAALSVLPTSQASPVSTALTAPPAQAAVPWACDIRTWVRAPDLAPNLRDTGDARVVTNGTGCADIVKWDIGLAMKERSIVRLRARDVQFPPTLVYNETADAEWWAAREDQQPTIYDAGLHQSWDWASSPAELARKAHAESMRNRSLWEVHGPERKVFDTQVTLFRADGMDHVRLPPKHVALFGIAVPNVNLPASINGDGLVSYGWDQSDYAQEETHFGYYSAFALRNGSVISLASGNTVLLPDPSPFEGYAGSDKVRLEMATLGSVDRRFEDSPEDQSCKRDNTTRFEVELSLSNRRTFVQGSQVNITATVRRLVNTTQGATYISLRPRSDCRRTWAAGFAHTEAQRAALSGETEQTLFGDDWGFERYSRMLMAHPVKSSAEEQRDLERGDDLMARRFRSRRSASRDKQYGAVLDPALDAQTVEVNLTIPLDMMPTTTATFEQYLSSLVVTLHTEQECNSTNSSANSATGHPLDDVEDDDAWSPCYRCRHFLPRPVSHALYQIHRANVSITIEPVTGQMSASTTRVSPQSNSALSSASPTHYLVAGAEAPLLYASQAGAGGAEQSPVRDVAYQHLSQVVVRQADHQLLASRYDNYGRAHHWRDDGHRNHVGQVWARKMQREKEAAAALRSYQSGIEREVVSAGLVFQNE